MNIKIEHVTLNIDDHIIEFMVEYETHDGKEWIYLSNGYLSCYVVGQTLEECLDAIEIQLRDTYEGYANCPDEKLDWGGQYLKQALHKVFPNGLKPLERESV